jgi:hypothetical protein
LHSSIPFQSLNCSSDFSAMEDRLNSIVSVRRLNYLTSNKSNDLWSCAFYFNDPDLA